MARLDGYQFGRIVVDGRQETRDLVVLPDGVVRDWRRRDGHALVLDAADPAGHRRAGLPHRLRHGQPEPLRQALLHDHVCPALQGVDDGRVLFDVVHG